MKTLVAIGVAAVASALPAGATIAPGLHGIVTRGPITPICTPDAPCTAPAKGAVLSFRSGTGVVHKVAVRDDGTYRVLLAPGPYAVTTASRRPITPATVKVLAGRNRKVDFSIDTGIR